MSDRGSDPLPGRRRIAAWLAGALLVGTGLAVAARLAADRIREPRRPAPPTASPSPSLLPSNLDGVEVERVGRAEGYPDGWRRWRASDGSFSVVLPIGSHPAFREYRAGLWLATFEGHAVRVYLYLSDQYGIGEDLRPFLRYIADGIAEDAQEVDRHRIRLHGARGLEVVFLDEGYRYRARIFGVGDRLFQLSTVYAEVLHDGSTRGDAERVLDSFRIRWDGAVSEGS